MLLKIPLNRIIRRESLRNHFPHIHSKKSHAEHSHSISQNTHSSQTLQFSFFVKITSTISFHQNIFVIQRFLQSTLFSSWETKEIDVQEG